VNLLHIDINWPQLKALHQVYLTGSTRSNLFSNPYLERLRKEKRVLRYRAANRGIIEATTLFNRFYQQHFLKAYERYLSFFIQSGVQSDGRRPYRLYDLETLIYIQENRFELASHLTTERTFASQLFSSSKYLENNNSVRNAVLQILEIGQFPKTDPRDHTWRLIVDCPDPICILLCENLDNLKCPEVAIDLGVELWYVGGNNTGILKNLSQEKLDLPIYYHCDWDYDGLRIYGNVNKIMEEKGKTIKILEPVDPSRRLPVNSPYHHSQWKTDKFFSGLFQSIYSARQLSLINELIAENQWIEEESQDFEALLKSNGCLDIVNQ
jgi:hypothetical protein